jgi:thiosulfate/3-mercaptopyruvate sulfurtransferase
MSPRHPLVSTQWLAERIEAPDIRIADASWYLPQAGRDAKTEYRAVHIPRATFFDIDDLSDDGVALPHMLAPPAKFASRMRRLGLGDGHLIVVYDGAGIYSSPRAWWMLRAMGHEEVVVLDGGLPKWRREGRPVEDLIPNPYPRHFTPRPNHALVRDFDRMMQNLKSREAQVVDARSAPRFRGEEEEPRAGVRRGHIPQSLNAPYGEFITGDGTLKPKEELLKIFTRHRIDPAKPAVTSCGSGVTAAIVALALDAVGAKDVSLYDGSWAEWGARAEAPVETG